MVTTGICYLPGTGQGVAGKEGVIYGGSRGAEGLMGEGQAELTWHLTSLLFTGCETLARLLWTSVS